MGERRIISKKVLMQPSFCHLPNASKILYCYLVLEADDEGFVSNAESVQKCCGFYVKSLQKLDENHFIYLFDSGVCVIKHWYWMNKIQPSKMKKTLHTAEKSKLGIDESGAYYLLGDEGVQRPEIRPNLTQLNLTEQCNTIRAKNCDKDCTVEDAKQLKAAAYTAEFEEVWALYPKKINKYQAFIAFQKALETGATVADIKAGIERYRDYIARKKIKERYIKHGSTFFNQRGWEDDYDIEIPSTKTELDEELLALF